MFVVRWCFQAVFPSRVVLSLIPAGPCDFKVGHKNKNTRQDIHRQDSHTDPNCLPPPVCPPRLSLARLPDLLLLGQQGPSAMDHGGGGLQRAAVHRHGALPRAGLRFPTHRPHRRGLGGGAGGPGRHHGAQR